MARAVPPSSWKPAAALGSSPSPDWQPFDATVQAAMQTFGMVGAAVAVVNRRGMVYRNTFGVRELASGAPVTSDTLFHVASTTKSMTALLVATFVDDGPLTWDQPVIDAWPKFRTPTEELTQTLRVRDLLGMDSGLGAPEPTDYHQSYPTALELLRSLAFLPVLGPPQTVFFYNNPVCAAAGYLPLLVQGTDPAALQSAYGKLMQERVFDPAGMHSARIADDPRPFSDDYATGYALDFVAGTVAEPMEPVGSSAPVGGTLASLRDIATYVRLQLNHGASASGTCVVSATNLSETWKPHIDITTSPELDPDVVSAGYAMGWNAQTYTGGHTLVWHNRGVDGFVTFIGFLPDDDVGLVVLMNEWLFPGAFFFYTYVLNLLLSARFGLNGSANDAVVAQYQTAKQQLLDKATQASPVDRAAIAPYLGTYEHGYQLAFDAVGVLRIRQSTRATRVLAMPDGTYIAASGILAGSPVRFSRDSTGNPQMAIEGAETVRWSSGPA